MTIHMLIQVAPGSTVRNLYNEQTLKLLETRRISHSYPYPYGFIIGTNAQDGDAVDCYLITKDTFDVGSIVECEPFGLLEQFEGDEIDHKVLAALPGQRVESMQELLKELRDFIYAIFAHYPEVEIHVGVIHPKDVALHYIQSHQSKVQRG